jgi:hypothetical protein
VSDERADDDRPDDDRPSDEKMYMGVEFDTPEGSYRPQQQNFAGKDNIRGGGEWPDPDTPPQPPAPGSAE